MPFRRHFCYTTGMRKPFAIAAIVLSLAAVSGTVLWVQHSRQAHRTADSLARTEQENARSDTRTPSTNPVISGSLQNQGITQQANAGQDPAQTASGSNATTAAPNSERATLNPAEFSVYDTYKTAQNTVFADIAVGNGFEATSGRKLSVNYRGWLTNGSIFDQNVDATKPFVFTLGAGSVIPGWEQGVNGMKVGGERLIIIPPAAGYGNIPQGPIPANSVLVFYVKLLSVQ